MLLKGSVFLRYSHFSRIPHKSFPRQFQRNTRKSHLKSKRLDLNSGELDSTPSSATDLLCDWEQIK